MRLCSRRAEREKTTFSRFRLDSDFLNGILEDIGELFQLRNIMPVCAWCRKIRGDESYWQRVEEYFGRCPELDFTHGLCEECFVRSWGRKGERTAKNRAAENALCQKYPLIA